MYCYYRLKLALGAVRLKVLKNLSGELAGSRNKQTIILFNWLLFILWSNVTKLAQLLFYNSLLNQCYTHFYISQETSCLLQTES